MIVVFTCPLPISWTRILLSPRLRRQVCCPDAYHPGAYRARASTDDEARAAEGVAAISRGASLRPPDHRAGAAAFSHAERHVLSRTGRLVQSFDAEFTPLLHHVLELFGVPASGFRG